VTACLRLWGARTASLQLAAACRQHSERLKTVSASCRDLQAGSLCSPDKIVSARRLCYPDAFVMSSEVETSLAIQSQRFLDQARNDKLANQIRSSNDHDFEGRALFRP